MRSVQRFIFCKQLGVVDLSGPIHKLPPLNSADMRVSSMTVPENGRTHITFYTTRAAFVVLFCDPHHPHLTLLNVTAPPKRCSRRQAAAASSRLFICACSFCPSSSLGRRSLWRQDARAPALPALPALPSRGGAAWLTCVSSLHKFSFHRNGAT